MLLAEQKGSKSSGSSRTLMKALGSSRVLLPPRIGRSLLDSRVSL